MRPAISSRDATRPVLDLVAVCVGSVAAIGSASGETADVAADTSAAVDTVTVTADRDHDSSTHLDKLPNSIQNTPITIDRVTAQAIQERDSTRLQDALRYVPGVTFNSGEGGAHGDNVNLRGFATIDDFFVDGIRDPGSYARDSFDIDAIDVLQGPAGVLFGNGSAGGVINQVTKQPLSAPRRVATLEFGSNGEARGTADVNVPLSDSAAIRLNIMGERTDVADRDYVHQERWGFAPAITLGLHDPTKFTLSYFHQEENNVPDYGIPFLFGEPAPVPRNFYYGLNGQDKTQTNVNIMTATLRHDFADGLSVSDTVRYGNYWANYRVTAPVFDCDAGIGFCTDGGGAPAPGTPLSQVLVYRDRPSSEGTNTYLTNHTDVTAEVATGPIAHLIVTGVEFGRETSDLVRFNNDIQGPDGTAPTPLLAPNANGPNSGTQTLINDAPNTTADTIGVYFIDTVKLADQIQLDLGVRYDRYDTSYNEAYTGAHFERIDTAWSPRAALVFKPTDTQSYYVSYAKSFDPVVSYLDLAPDSSAPPPERGKTIEVGAKTRLFSGSLFGTVAAFRTDLTNARIADPDDPTLQEVPGTSQRVQGVELGLSGYVTPQWEVTLNYTFLEPTIRTSTDQNAVGKLLPGAPRHSANLWTVYKFSDDFRVGTGVNYVGHRFADDDNTANIPSYIIWSGMAGYQWEEENLDFQLNIQNITDVYYYAAAYYTSADENHALPGAGRTVTLSTSFHF